MHLAVIRRFAADETGAVTVDWVVLTAAIVGMAFAVFTIITRETVTVGASAVSNTLVDAANYDPGFGSRSGAQEPDGATPPDPE
jgi:Flp pilus assembly pilin Flp